MEHHLLILNDSNESHLCRFLLKTLEPSFPLVVLYGPKVPDKLSDLYIESSELEHLKDSTTDSNNYKYSVLYKELNKSNSLTHQEFEELYNNLVKYLKTVLFRPVLLLFKKSNNFLPNVLFNFKPILLYLSPLYNLHKVDGQKKQYREDKNLLYWYLEFDYNLNNIGTNNRLLDLLDELENTIEEYNLDNKFVQSILSLLNMYVDRILFRNISLTKYTKVLKYSKQYSTLLNTHLSSTGTYTHAKGSTTEAQETSSKFTEKGEVGHEELDKSSESADKLNLVDYKKLFLENKKPYHLASAIAYTNGLPHVGHAYEAVVCDVISRYYRMFGRRVIFSTGTDEHGIKVLTTAKQQNKTPIEVCNYYSNEFKKFYKRLLVEYDRFIRTTSESHMKAAKTIWRTVFKKGDIYLGEYNGYYSMREERFIPNTEAKLTDFKDPVSGKPYDLMSESSYFFKMERYRTQLVDYINTNQDFIYPKKVKNEILTRLKDQLDDLSISRTSFDWGIEVPSTDDIIITEYVNNDVNVGYNHENKLFNESKFYNEVNKGEVAKKVKALHSDDQPESGETKVSLTSNQDQTSSEKKVDSTHVSPNTKKQENEKHVMYVWFDALSFYMTSSGLGESLSEMMYWPTDLQVIGKDISWFQSVILATMCFSMGLPLTRKILAHGFIQGSDGRKMSKSLGNVLNLDELLQEVGVESFRYYLLKSTVMGSDVNFDQNQLKEMHNSDLADNVGNLVHRLTSLVTKYNEGVVPSYKSKVKSPFDLVEFMKDCSDNVLKLDVYNILILTNMKFKDLNNYLTVTSPWAEKNQDKRDSVLRVLLECVYFLAHFLYPVLPQSMEHLFSKLGTPQKQNVWELSLNLDNLEKDSKVSVGDILYQKFNLQEKPKA
ncbi:methionyl-tRNA synthetase, putative [Theileria annulata]|uniref:methionine--tRNA ligase n=1 Tax=Theileria annulata TaxID=5874 RepID=Q4UCT9_THEAN|nr:methionyl-tRNA synthetase, putative [Theileria annulata]CAI75362.1 methionyl-tRNA synthetase, putative [Theileria annulata]|eukprot:XP_954838.1 methionyl-tRNA synthetase, putative [Theileria annulata]